MGWLGCPETSARSYHSTLRKIQRNRGCLSRRSGSLKSTISILPFKERLGFLRSLFFSLFLTRLPKVFFGLHTCHMPRPSNLPRHCEIDNIYWESQIIQNLVMQFALEFSLFVFTCKHLHLPQSYIIHHQALMFLKFDKPNWTLTQSNRQNCAFLYLSYEAQEFVMLKPMSFYEQYPHPD